MIRVHAFRPRAALALLAVLLLPSLGHAQEPFYKGKTISLIIGSNTSGGYDTYGRLLARHMGKHLAGNPSFVTQNMPGAGGLRVAQFLYTAAPKDGLTFGTFTRMAGIAPLADPTQKYDAAKFTWLGAITDAVSVCITWHTSPVKTWNDIITKDFTVGGEGSGSDPDVYALLLKNAFGAKLKLITGYPGTAEIAIALERGEVDSRASWSWTSLKTLKPNWIAEKKVNFPVQLNLTRGADLQDVPLVTELAKNDKQRQMLKLILSRQEMARPYAAPPGIPDDRKAALRKAFDDSWADPELLAEMKARGQEVNPVSGAALDRLIAELYATPKDVVEQTRRAIGGQ